VETVADRRRGNPGGTFIRKATAGFGAVADIGVYALDTALWLMGHPKPVAVSGISSNVLSLTNTYNPALRKTEVEDFACGWVLFDNGARMVFKTCWCMHMDSLGGTVLLGTKAGLRIGVGEVRGPEEGVTLYKDEYGQPVDIKVPTHGDVDVFRAEDAAFVDAVREGKPSPINPDGMLLTNVIIQGVIDSNKAGGREVKVNVPTFK
jgi:predicted dehydrogenase